MPKNLSHRVSSLRTKFLLMPLCLVVCAIVLASIYLDTLSKQNRAIDLFAEKQLNSGGNMANLYADFSINHLALYHFIHNSKSNRDEEAIYEESISILDRIDENINAIDGVGEQLLFSESVLSEHNNLLTRLRGYRSIIVSSLRQASINKLEADVVMENASLSYANATQQFDHLLSFFSRESQRDFIALKEIGKDYFNKLIVVLALFIVIIFIVSLLFTRLTIGPILKLLSFANQIEKGDLGIRISHVTRDEFGDLAIAFNKMVSTLSHTSEKMNNEIRLMATVFENTDNGVLILDPDFHVMNLNNAYYQISGFSLEHIKGLELTDKSKSIFIDCNDIWTRAKVEGRWQGEISGLRKSSTEFPIDAVLNSVADKKNRTSHYVLVIRDISHQKRTEQELWQLANYDSLTGLPNRGFFLNSLKAAISRSDRAKDKLAVFFIDVNRFKQINDSLGHTFGDLLLQAVANRLNSQLREIDIVARLGGDEFTLILDNIATSTNAQSIAKKLIAAFEEDFHLQDHPLNVDLSIGIAIYPDHGIDEATLMKNSDVAMYTAKQDPTCSFRMYNKPMKQPPT